MSKKALLEALLSVAEEEKEYPLPPAEEQESLIRAFINQDPLKVGDEVVRTENGTKRYVFPKEGQRAFVCTVFAAPLMENHDTSTGEIAVIQAGSRGPAVVVYPVDLRYYKKAPGQTAH